MMNRWLLLNFDALGALSVLITTFFSISTLTNEAELTHYECNGIYNSFFIICIFLATISVFVEAVFYRAIVDKINDRVGRYYFFMVFQCWDVECFYMLVAHSVVHKCMKSDLLISFPAICHVYLHSGLCLHVNTE
jgi:hypothetical protein